MKPYLFLLIAIVAEVIATTALKSTEGFTKLIPSAVVVIGYGTAFYFLALVLKFFPLGITYAIWSGLGIVLVTLTAYLFYHQTIDLAALIGMIFIILGVAIIHLFSKSMGH